MPTFGYSGQGASDLTFGAGCQAHLNTAQHYTAATGKAIKSYSIYTRVTTGTGTIEVGSYDMGSGGSDPDGASLLGKQQIAGITNTSIELKTSATVEHALTSGNGYCVALGYGEESGANVKVAYDAPGGSQVKRMNTTGSLPATFSANLSDASQLWSIFATYGDEIGPPTFSGPIPDQNELRTDVFSFDVSSYFTNDPTSYSAVNLPVWLDIDNDGIIHEIGAKVTSVNSGVVVTASNAQSPPTASSNSFSITISAQLPVETLAISDVNGNAGSPITPVDLTAHVDFATGYTGSLPDGLSIVGQSLQGTPTVQATTTVNLSATNPDGSTALTAFDVIVGAALPVPTIAAVNSGNGFQRDTSITITGTNFGAVQGAATIVVGGVDITSAITAWGDTSITLDFPGEGFTLGSIYSLVITNDSGYSNVSASFEHTSKTGEAYATMGVSYSQLPTDSFMDGVAQLANLVIGDQVIYTTAASPQGTVSVDSQGVAIITGAGLEGAYTFNYMINDISDLTVSDTGLALVTFNSSDDDIVAPVWTSSPVVSNIGQTTFTVNSTIDETGDTFIVVVPASESIPSPANVIAGQNAAGGSPAFSGSSLAGTAAVFNVTGLTNNTAYFACLVARDDEITPNVQASVYTVAATTILTPDVTPPVFTVAPSVNGITQSKADATASIDETGSIFVMVINQGLADPTVGEIIAGEYTVGDEIVSPIAYISGSSLSNVELSGLPSGTPLKACFAARDSSNNAQVSPVIVNFTTSQAGTVRSLSIDIVDVQGNTDANQLLDWYVKDSWGNITDSGQDSTDGGGTLNLTNLEASAGSGYIAVKDPNDSNIAAVYPVTITEA